MAIEVTSDSAICCKCGLKFSRRKGYFPVSYAVLHKGLGYIPVCKDCIDTMYNTYLAQCNNAKDAVRQMCRKLDLYWNENVFEDVLKKNSTRTMMTQYIAKLSTIKYAGKSYDDTLSDEGTLWNFNKAITAKDIDNMVDAKTDTANVNEENNEIKLATETPQEIIDFWGNGYSDEMYEELEKKKEYWVSRLPEGTVIDIGTEAIIKQICFLEIDINRDRIAGKSVDKNVNTLNTLLGSANLKPTQQQKANNDSSIENTPFGVWIQKWETKRPIPETDPELKDSDGLVKYILTWLYGHLAKMLNIKNAHSQLYDDAIEKLRVDHPEYNDEDDEELLYDIFKDDNNEGGGGDDNR